ncbi:multicopper oxidase domain-containing protein [Thiopseudomonas alkaliphila]|nr:multicopper oxidase domain-containing protein [Thiopseudomonas alkaliphila]MDM1708875.1 multicopper oxidase domain-containing protein [Thiopseudomonas alkaliphila]
MQLNTAIPAFEHLITGEVEKWEVFNNSYMDHPFHLNGTQLVITKRVLNGQETSEAFKALRDTFNLKPYKHITFKVKQNNNKIAPVPLPYFRE